jgi:chromate reductase, NAD(P)H dehydrogenase (quinone)
MAAVIVEPASMTIPLLGSHLDDAGMIENPVVASLIRSSLWALREAVASRGAIAMPTFLTDTAAEP